MTREEKRLNNQENEGNYHFAPFTDQRADLRKEWSLTRKNWESFLYDQEKKYQSKIKAL
jgi:hypothetical protein